MHVPILLMYMVAAWHSVCFDFCAVFNFSMSPLEVTRLIPCLRCLPRNSQMKWRNNSRKRWKVCWEMIPKWRSKLKNWQKLQKRQVCEILMFFIVHVLSSFVRGGECITKQNFINLQNVMLILFPPPPPQKITSEKTKSSCI